MSSRFESRPHPRDESSSGYDLSLPEHRRALRLQQLISGPCHDGDHDGGADLLVVSAATYEMIMGLAAIIVDFEEQVCPGLREDPSRLPNDTQPQHGMRDALMAALNVGRAYMSLEAARANS